MLNGSGRAGSLLWIVTVIGCAPSPSLDAGAHVGARDTGVEPVDAGTAAPLDAPGVLPDAATSFDAQVTDTNTVDAFVARDAFAEPVATFTLANGRGPTVTFTRTLWRTPEVTVGLFLEYAAAGYPEATAVYPNGATFTVRGSPAGTGAPCTLGPVYAGRSDRDSFPINCVTWETAMAYCAWRGGRLPTEAEWEWSVNGIPNESDTASIAFGNFVGSPQIRPTGDPVGNVSEWTADVYVPYTDPRWADTTDPLIEGGIDHSVRGANFTGYTLPEETFARTRRHAIDPSEEIGFVCVFER